jgi:rhodanese-related sulfurtransferase
MPTTMELSPQSTMQEILQEIPGAQRALFRLYHIGGCSSCGFQPEETFSAVCARHGVEEPARALARVKEEAAQEERWMVSPLELASELVGEDPPTLVDIRTREEFDAVAIAGSHHLTQPLMQEILGTWPKDVPLVLVDHLGQRALDAAAYLQGHGMTNLRVLRGGIDRWSIEVNPELPRYTLE